MQRSKISDVAKLAGVSPSTVSNYLNGRYGSMSSQTKLRVQDAVRKLNYSPNIGARMLSSKENCGTVCLVIPRNIASFFDTSYYTHILSSLGTEAEKVGVNMLIYTRNSHEDKGMDIAYLKGMYGTIADGFILLDLNVNDTYFREFERENIPYVCVGKIFGVDDYCYTATDHEQGIREIMEHLLQLGHKRIGLQLLAGMSVTPKLRYEGYCSALHSHSIPVDPRYVLYLEPQTSDNQITELFRSTLALDDAPTAMILSTRFSTLLEKAITTLNLHILRDISVVLTDYNERSYDIRRNYTRLENVYGEIATESLRMLMRRIEYPDSTVSSKMITPRLVPGHTTTHAPSLNRAVFP